MKASDLNIGDTVAYCATMRSGITSQGHVVKEIKLNHDFLGLDVAWITNKSGFVCISNLIKQ